MSSCDHKPSNQHSKRRNNPHQQAHTPTLHLHDLDVNALVLEVAGEQVDRSLAEPREERAVLYAAQLTAAAEQARHVQIVAEPGADVHQQLRTITEGKEHHLISQVVSARLKQL